MTYVEDYTKRLQQIQALNMLGSAVPSPASKSEIANMILQKARSDFSVHIPQGTDAPKAEKKSLGKKAASFGLKILDVLARPNYAVAEASDRVFNENGGVGDFVKGLGAGISGKDKTSFIDVLQNQYQNDVRETPDYKAAAAQYGGDQADKIFASDLDAANRNPKAILGGFITDVGLDPLNILGAGAVTKPLKALTSTDKALEGAATGTREIATEAAPEVVQQATKGAEKTPVEAPQGTGLTQGLIDSLSKAKRESGATATEIPRVTGKFASNRRPPVKSIEGEPVQALYGEQAQNFVGQLRANPRYANITDVFKGDLKQKDFEKLQEARNINETAQVVDQVAKGKLPAVDLITHKPVEPLPPVARRLVNNSVAHAVNEIVDASKYKTPAAASAAGKQFRHAVNNAPTQSNLSSRLTNAARAAFTAETGQKVTKAASPHFIPAIYDRYLNMLRNAEESMIAKGRDELNDAYYPRGGIKPNSPYLRLSDVLTALPRELAQKTILGPRIQDKVLPGVLLKAITGNRAALGRVAQQSKELFNAIQSTDWQPLMVKEYATRTIDSANAAHDTLDTAAGFVNQIKAAEASDTFKAAGFDEVTKAGKKQMANEMPAAKSSVNEVLDGLRKSVGNPMPSIVDTVIERGKNKLAAAVFSAKAAKEAQPHIVETAAKGVEEIAQTSAKQAGLDPALAASSADNVFSTVLSYIKPNAGYKDLRPVILKNISVRKSSAATRAHEIIKIFQDIPKEGQIAFWNTVRFTDMPPVAGQEESVKLMRKMMGNMFGESGLSAKFAGNTSLSRSGLNIDHLNKHLRIVGIHDFKFERDVPNPLDPTKKVRLGPEEILNGWKNYQPKDSGDLRVFTHNLSQAVENAMVEHSVWANIGALWGSKNPGANLIQVTGMHPAVDHMYFPKDLAPQMGKVARGIDEMFESVSNSKLMRAYDTALRTWKTGVTIYAPSHHIRNMVGDVFMSYLDGLSDPKYYGRAATMLKSNHNRYSDIKVGKNPLSDILGEGVEADTIGKIIGQSQESIPKGTRVIAKAKVGNKNHPITVDQAYRMAYRQGIFPHSAQIEDLPGTETLMETLANKFHPDKAGVFAPAKGKVATKVRSVSETREHYVRAAHWLYALENTKANSLEELFQLAGNRVRKYHPDGLDLTHTEKKVFRRVFPFYSWTRKAIPLVLEGMVMDPKKILMYPMVTSSIQESQGIDSSVGDPWPDDQLFPDWLASNVIGPTIPWESSFAKAIARSDAEVGYGVVNPGNPATDILDQFASDPVGGIGNSLSPFAKIPAEILTGHEIQTHAPIKDKTDYINKNIPMLSTASRLSNGAIGAGVLEGGDLKGTKETSPFNPSALINYLTGAGILDTGRYKKSAEFDLKARLAKEKANGAQ